MYLDVNILPISFVTPINSREFESQLIISNSASFNCGFGEISHADRLDLWGQQFGLLDLSIPGSKHQIQPQHLQVTGCGFGIEKHKGDFLNSLPGEWPTRIID